MRRRPTGRAEARRRRRPREALPPEGIWKSCKQNISLRKFWITDILHNRANQF